MLTDMQLKALKPAEKNQRRLAALDPTVVAHYKRVMNAIGLDRFDRAIEEESDATCMLMRAFPPSA